jgi:predicted MFS family arabinose efflux permease
MNNGSAAISTIIPTRVILPILCVCSFSNLLNMRSISPILVDISQEFGISVAVAGSLGAAYSLPAAFLAVIFGPLSDRYGRRTLMIFGLCALLLASLGATLAPTFTVLLLCRTFAGLGAAALSPSIFAAVGDYFPYSERGRAFGWVISGTTMAVVAGLPLGSLLAGYLSWRWMFGLLTCIFFIVITLVIIFLPMSDDRHKSKASGLTHYKSSFSLIMRNRSTMIALLSSSMFGIFWQGWATYTGAFFIETYNITTEALAPIFTIQGFAILIASRFGGVLADRFSKKSLAAIGMIVGGIFMILLTNIHGALGLGIALNTIMAIPASMRFVAGNALISELVPNARGTMVSMNTSANEVGTMTGSAIGGLTIAASGGYGVLGLAFGSAVIFGAFLLHSFVVEGGQEESFPNIATIKEM